MKTGKLFIQKDSGKLMFEDETGERFLVESVPVPTDGTEYVTFIPFADGRYIPMTKLEELNTNENTNQKD